jgi:hypothetical protein
MALDWSKSSYPRLPYSVIDQNSLRDQTAVSTAIANARNGRLILLHDIAVVEMTKSAEWSDTLRRSLQLLAQYPQGVVAGHATGELLRREMRTGEPHIDIVDHQWTASLRHYLPDIAAGVPDVMKMLQASVPAAKEIADAQQLDTASNKRILLNAVEMWKSELKGDELKQLRKGDEPLMQHLLSERRMMRTIADSLEAAGYDRQQARHLAAVPSVSAHNWLCLAANSLQWLAQGGLHSLTDDKFTNDLCDMDYLLAASFCEELISKEKKMTLLHNRIRHVVDLRWSEIRAEIEKTETESNSTPPSERHSVDGGPAAASA